MTVSAPAEDTAARLLAFGGVALMIAGMVFGDLFAIFVLHQNNARLGETMYAAATNITAGNTEAIFAQFQEIGGYLSNRGSKVAAHTHAVAVGFLAVILSVLQPYSAHSAAARRQLAQVYIACGLMLPVAVFFIHYVGLKGSPFEYFGWASLVANITGTVLAIVVCIQLAGLWKGRRGTVGGLPLPAVREAGKTLLAGGVLLLAAGFLYGAGYAAYLQFGLPASEADILNNIIGNAASGESFDAEFGAYGNYQALRGINTAAHSHVNTMALLLLVLALVQPFVRLQPDWKRRWARILVAASFLLPVCILLEFRFGRAAGAAADVVGFTGIAALVAMLIGLARGSGRGESSAESANV